MINDDLREDKDKTIQNMKMLLDKLNNDDNTQFVCIIAMTEGQTLLMSSTNDKDMTISLCADIITEMMIGLEDAQDVMVDDGCDTVTEAVQSHVKKNFN